MTIVGRAKLDHPAFLTAAGGGTLHTTVEGLWTQVSDHIPGRVKQYSALANSTLSTYEHGFDVPFDDLRVNIYTGTIGSGLTPVLDPVTAGWTIVATSGFLKTKIDVTTPSSGGPHTFVVQVVEAKRDRQLDVVQIAAPAAPAASTYRLYVDAADGKLKKKDSSNAVVNLEAASSTATPTVSGIVTSYAPIVQSSTKILSGAGYTVTTTDGYADVLVTTGASDRTIGLPAAASNAGRRLTVTKTDNGSGFVIIDANASETINGKLTYNLYTNLEFVTLICDGTSWYVSSASGSNWIDGSSGVTTQGFGTISNLIYLYKKNTNGTIDVLVEFTSGSSTGAEARFDLPAGLTSDSSRFSPSNFYIVGDINNANTGSENLVIIAGNKTYFNFSSPGAYTTANNGTTMAASGWVVQFCAKDVPVV